MARRRRPESIAERIDQLMEDVFVSDAAERMARVAQHLAPDFVFVNPGSVLEGAEGLCEAYQRYRHDAWRKVALARTTELDVHHAHFRFAWERTEGARVVRHGWCFGWVAADGRLSRLVSFHDPVAPLVR